MCKLNTCNGTAKGSGAAQWIIGFRRKPIEAECKLINMLELWLGKEAWRYLSICVKPNVLVTDVHGILDEVEEWATARVVPIEGWLPAEERHLSCAKRMKRAKERERVFE